MQSKKKALADRTNTFFKLMKNEKAKDTFGERKIDKYID